MSAGKLSPTVGSKEDGYLFEFKADGVFLTVFPSEDEGILFELSDMRQILKDYGVLDYEIESLARIVREAKGEPRKLADGFEAVIDISGASADEEVALKERAKEKVRPYKVEVTRDKMAVFIRFDRKATGVMPDLDEILEALENNRVTYGIDKDAISNFESELYDKGLNESLSVNTNLDIIEGSTSVIGNVKSFAVSFLIVVLVIGSIILIVINAINIRERKYEIGVLRTIGMKKVVLTFQFLSELLMVTLVSLVFGILVGSFISVPVSNNLLKSEIESSQKQVDDIIGNFKGENFDFSRVNGINKINEFESIDATVNAYVLVYVLLIGLSLTCVSTLSSMISIQRFKPLTILKERS